MNDHLTLREAAIEAILIREQDTAFSTVARIIASLPQPDAAPGIEGLRALLAKADLNAGTPGMWSMCEDGRWAGIADFGGEQIAEGLTEPDAALIAAAVNYVRAALAAAPPATERSEGRDVHYERCHSTTCPCYLDGLTAAAPDHPGENGEPA